MGNPWVAAAFAIFGGVTSMVNSFKSNSNLKKDLEKGKAKAEENRNRASASLRENSRQLSEETNAKKTYLIGKQQSDQAKLGNAISDRGVAGVTADQLITNSIMGGSLNLAGVESTKDNQDIGASFRQSDIDMQRANDYEALKVYRKQQKIGTFEAHMNAATAASEGFSMGMGMGGSMPDQNANKKAGGAVGEVSKTPNNTSYGTGGQHQFSGYGKSIPNYMRMGGY